MISSGPLGDRSGKPVEFAFRRSSAYLVTSWAEAEPIRAQTPRNQGQSHEIGDA